MTTAPAPDGHGCRSGPGPAPLTVTGLLLLDPHGNDPTTVDSIIFDDSGIGVVRTPGRGGPGPALGRRWSPTPSSRGPAGSIPAWWVEPEASAA